MDESLVSDPLQFYSSEAPFPLTCDVSVHVCQFSAWFSVSIGVYYQAEVRLIASQGWLPCMMTSSNGNIFHVTGPLWGETTGHWWILLTKASDAELWCFFDPRLNKQLSKQSGHRWFETPSHSLWRHCNGVEIGGIDWLLRDWMIDWSIDRLLIRGRVNDIWYTSLVDRSIDWLLACLIGWLTDGLIYLSVGRLRNIYVDVHTISI